MAWARRGSKVYFYRSRRVGDRVLTEYLGTGPAAHLAASLAERRKADRQALADARQQFQACWDSAADQLRRLAVETNGLVATALSVSGYHCYDRRWRRRRSGMPELIDPPAGMSPEILNRFAELADQVRAGDADAKAKLKELFNESPELFRTYGDMAAAARATWVSLATQDDPAVALQVTRHLAELEADLVRPGASRLERLLAARVATCDLVVATADALASTAMTKTGAIGRDAIQRQRSANNMLLAAARTLAMCQKLLKPPMSPLDMLQPQAEQAPRGRPHTEQVPGRRTGRRAGVPVGMG
jgi:hypothetical protein